MSKEHLRSFKDWPFKPTLPLLDVEEGYIAVRFRIEEIPGQHIIVSFDEICLSDKLNRTYRESFAGIVKNSNVRGKDISVQIRIDRRQFLKSGSNVTLCFLAEDQYKYEARYLNDREKGMLLEYALREPLDSIGRDRFQENFAIEDSEPATPSPEDSHSDYSSNNQQESAAIPDLDEYKRALLREKYYLQQEGGRKHKVTNGIRISIQNGFSIYSFEMEAELNLTDDAPVSLTVGSSTVAGTVLVCEGFQILLVIPQDFGTNINQALIGVEPWKLLEALVNRLDQIQFENRIALKLLQDGPKLATADPADTIPKGQMSAIEIARKNEITVIWGPPGTGKTYTMAQIAREGLQKGKTILIVSHSNVSVDGVVKQTASELRKAGMGDLLKSGRALRYGYVRDEELFRDDEAVAYSYVLSHHPDLKNRIEQLQADKGRLIRTGRYHSDQGARIEKELKMLRTEVRSLERTYVEDAQLVATTISKVTVDPMFDKKLYDIVMFDEVSMAYVPQIVCAAMFATEKLILVGDFRQLAPIVQSEVKKTLEVDIFSYLGISKAGKVCAHPWLVMLNEQRRMHPAISAFPNKYVYGNLLKNHPSVSTSRNDIVNNEPLSGSAANLINLTGTYCAAMKNSDNSRFNILSAVIAFLTALQAEENGEKSVGIITPYAAQTRLIRAMIQDTRSEQKTDIVCSTVHQFQGSERNVIIFDAVESYPASKVGWLMGKGMDSVMRLINVAVTRARGKLVVVANERFWENKFGGTSHIFYRLIQYLLQHGKVVSTKEKNLAPYISELPFIKNICLYEFSEEAIDDFRMDLEAAEEKVVISIPDGQLDPDTGDTVLRAILEAKAKGIRVLSKTGGYQDLPEDWKNITWASENAVFPLIVIDDAIAWYGLPQSRGMFKDGDKGYMTICPTIYRIKGEHTIEMIKAFSDLEYRIIDGQRKPLPEKTTAQKEDRSDNGKGTAGLDKFIRSNEHCPKCKSPMMLTRSKAGKNYLRCSSASCKEMSYLTPELTNWYINREHVTCPIHHCGIYAALGKYGIYIRCEQGHYLKPDEI